MDKLSKALSRLTKKERRQIKEILNKVKESHFENLAIKKLVGYKDIFRIRKGKIRIILKIGGSKNIKILAIERRSEKTYRNL